MASLVTIVVGLSLLLAALSLAILDLPLNTGPSGLVLFLVGSLLAMSSLLLE